ncbi:MAG: DUF1801 domain-containing protein [Treponema sp.]|jgi:uncharacterized protein YdhG (YjbR/CyaY superfamily)|nr:DUF1801 domain-containing protein [Treponema sp.]
MAKKTVNVPAERSQTAAVAAASTIAEYISSYTGDIKKRLKQIRETIHSSAPESIEKISWSMPTYWQNENLVHFAAMKKHIGIYPGAEAVAAFAKELEGFKTTKGAIQLPHDKALPLELISKIVKFRVKAVTGKKGSK